MLTSTQAAILNNKIAGQLDKIGDELMPVTKQNTEHYAWRYFLAAKIESYGKKLRDKTRKDAVKAGVLFDHEQDPREPGTNETVYSGDVVQISCAVKNGASSVDGKAFYSAIMASGLIDQENMDVFQQLYINAHKVSRPAHTFTVELRTE